MLIIGLMSGTSADGIDAAVVNIDGIPPALRWQVLQHIWLPHSPALREEIFACFHPHSSGVDRLCRLNFALGQAFGQAAVQAAAAAGLQMHQVDLIGSHGQTVWHEPQGEIPSTLQLGEPAVIAELTGRPVVSNFRCRDIAAGGQGAPLVAYVDALLLTHPTRSRAVQNIGGIANVTYLPAAAGTESTPIPASTLSFDTGPGNMLIDDAASRATQGSWNYDHDGTLAAQGKVNQALLENLLEHPYFYQPPPKTTGREQFGRQLGQSIWEEARRDGMSAEDILATLTALTAHSIARAYRQFLPAFPDEVILSGGGVRNPVLIAMLRQLLLPAELRLSDEFGLMAEVKESLAFAILAYETWHHRPGNLPAATGAHRPVVLGNITP